MDAVNVMAAYQPVVQACGSQYGCTFIIRAVPASAIIDNSFLQLLICFCILIFQDFTFLLFFLLFLGSFSVCVMIVAQHISGCLYLLCPFHLLLKVLQLLHLILPETLSSQYCYFLGLSSGAL